MKTVTKMVGLAAVAALGTATTASAVPVTFDLSGGPNSWVSITSLDTICVFGDCGATVALNPMLDSLSATLSAGESWAFDFFSISFYGLGAGEGNLAASLGFDAPTGAPNADGTGEGTFLSTGLSTGFLFSAGNLTWITQPGPFSLPDGTTYTVSFDNLFGITIGDEVNVRALLTLNTEPQGVPEPGMLGLFGIGLLGAAFAARRRRMDGTRS